MGTLPSLANQLSREESVATLLPSVRWSAWNVCELQLHVNAIGLSYNDSEKA
jgi:hypothetical protein